MRAPEDVDVTEAEPRLRDVGVLIEPGHPFFYGTNRPRNYYRLAYSSVPAERIAPGIELLARELEKARGTGANRGKSDEKTEK